MKQQLKEILEGAWVVPVFFILMTVAAFLIDFILRILG